MRCTCGRFDKLTYVLIDKRGGIHFSNLQCQPVSLWRYLWRKVLGRYFVFENGGGGWVPPWKMRGQR